MKFLCLTLLLIPLASCLPIDSKADVKECMKAYSQIIRDLRENWESPIAYLKKRGYMPKDAEKLYGIDTIELGVAQQPREMVCNANVDEDVENYNMYDDDLSLDNIDWRNAEVNARKRDLLENMKNKLFGLFRANKVTKLHNYDKNKDLSLHNYDYNKDLSKVKTLNNDFSVDVAHTFRHNDAKGNTFNSVNNAEKTLNNNFATDVNHNFKSKDVVYNNGNKVVNNMNQGNNMNQANKGNNANNMKPQLKVPKEQDNIKQKTQHKNVLYMD